MSDFELRLIRVETQTRMNFAEPVSAESPKQNPPTPAPIVDPMTEFFGEVISSYSRRQAIEDGILVQLSGEGYEGDEWIPAMVSEAGFKFPVAITVEAFTDCVAMTKGAEKGLQDIKGRLWDVLWMLKDAFRRHRGPTDRIDFVLHCSIDRAKPQRVELKALIGPGDDHEPVITIMYPWED